MRVKREEKEERDDGGEGEGPKANATRATDAFLDAFSPPFPRVFLFLHARAGVYRDLDSLRVIPFDRLWRSPARALALYTRIRGSRSLLARPAGPSCECNCPHVRYACSCAILRSSALFCVTPSFKAKVCMLRPTSAPGWTEVVSALVARSCGQAQIPRACTYCDQRRGVGRG